MSNNQQDGATPLPDWLEPLRHGSERKHRSRGVKQRLTDPALKKEPRLTVRCRITPQKLRFETEDDAIEYRMGADREWLQRTEIYPCPSTACGGYHFRTKLRARNADQEPNR